MIIIHINWINCVDSFKLFMPLEIRQDTHFSCSHNISFFVVKHQTTFTFTQEDIELFYDDLEEDFEEGQEFSGGGGGGDLMF